jgi:hypothetical protein
LITYVQIKQEDVILGGMKVMNIIQILEQIENDNKVVTVNKFNTNTMKAKTIALMLEERSKVLTYDHEAAMILRNYGYNVRLYKAVRVDVIDEQETVMEEELVGYMIEKPNTFNSINKIYA